MVFDICGTETVTIKTVFGFAKINVCFNVSFFDFNNIVNKKNCILGIKCKFFPQIIAINIVIVVNSGQAIITCN